MTDEPIADVVARVQSRVVSDDAVTLAREVERLTEALAHARMQEAEAVAWLERGVAEVARLTEENERLRAALGEIKAASWDGDLFMIAARALAPTSLVQAATCVACGGRGWVQSSNGSVRCSQCPGRTAEAAERERDGLLSAVVALADEMRDDGDAYVASYGLALRTLVPEGQWVELEGQAARHERRAQAAEAEVARLRADFRALRKEWTDDTFVPPWLLARFDVLLAPTSEEADAEGGV